MTAGELSKLTGLTTGAVTGLIDRLETKKLVRRDFDNDDRRKIRIVPNPENAMNVMGSAFEDLQNRMVQLISTLNDNEINIIQNYLLSTIEVMKDVTNKLNDNQLTT